MATNPLVYSPTSSTCSMTSHNSFDSPALMTLEQQHQNSSNSSSSDDITKTAKWLECATNFLTKQHAQHQSIKDICTTTSSNDTAANIGATSSTKDDDDNDDDDEHDVIKKELLKVEQLINNAPTIDHNVFPRQHYQAKEKTTKCDDNSNNKPEASSSLSAAVAVATLHHSPPCSRRRKRVRTATISSEQQQDSKHLPEDESTYFDANVQTLSSSPQTKSNATQKPDGAALSSVSPLIQPTLPNNISQTMKVKAAMPEPDASNDESSIHLAAIAPHCRIGEEEKEQQQQQPMKSASQLSLETRTNHQQEKGSQPMSAVEERTNHHQDEKESSTRHQHHQEQDKVRIVREDRTQIISDSNIDKELMETFFVQKPLRRGKWTVEEEEYVTRIIRDFNEGYLEAKTGTTLRSYLSSKLHCDPMRITKKFTGGSCIGKRVYHPSTAITKVTGDDKNDNGISSRVHNKKEETKEQQQKVIVENAQHELEQLRWVWIKRLYRQEQEAAAVELAKRECLISTSSENTIDGRWMISTPSSLKSKQQQQQQQQQYIPDDVKRTATWLDRASNILSQEEEQKQSALSSNFQHTPNSNVSSNSRIKMSTLSKSDDNDNSSCGVSEKQHFAVDTTTMPTTTTTKNDVLNEIHQLIQEASAIQEVCSRLPQLIACDSTTNSNKNIAESCST